MVASGRQDRRVRPAALVALLVIGMELCQVAEAGAGLTTNKANGVKKGLRHNGGGGLGVKLGQQGAAEIDAELATDKARLECGQYATAQLVLAEQDDLDRGDNDDLEVEAQTTQPLPVRNPLEAPGEANPEFDGEAQPRQAWTADEVEELVSETTCEARMGKVRLFLEYFHGGSERFHQYATVMSRRNYLVCEMDGESIREWTWDKDGSEESCDDAWARLLRKAGAVVAEFRDPSRKPAWLTATQEALIDWKQVARVSLVSSGVGVMATGAYLVALGVSVASSDMYYTSKYDELPDGDPIRKEFPNDKQSRFGPVGGKEAYAKHMIKGLLGGPVLGSLAPEMQSLLLSAGSGFASGGTMVGFGGAFAAIAGSGTTLLVGRQFSRVQNERELGEYMSYDAFIKKRFGDQGQ